MTDNYLFKHTDFNSFVTIISEEIDLSKGIIEKDYWVTRVLRHLVNSEFNNEFIFKGGTCLTKVWFDSFGRFSEDIDLLLFMDESNYGKKKLAKIKKDRLKNLIDNISDIEGLNFREEDSTDFNKAGGKFYFNYTGNNKDNCPKCIKPDILLEPGYRGGINPYSIKKINSLIGTYILKKYDLQLPDELSAFSNDINPFEIKVLSPERIFLEKLDALRNAFNKGELKNSTRHYYDLFKLIDLEEVQNLKNNKHLIDSILKDISIVSKTYYGLKSEIVLDDFISCEIFYLDFKDYKSIKTQYYKENDLYYNNQPIFEDIINKISHFLQALTN